MDAQAKKALYRAKLKAQKQDKRIDSPLVRYNESDQPVCKVCDIVLKSESAWSAHQISAKHREAIKNLKANAAAAGRVNNANPGASKEFDRAKLEHPAESNKSQTGPPQAQSQSVLTSNFFDKPESKKQKNGPPQAQSQSVLPSNFFDKPESKKQKNESADAKLLDNNKKTKVVGSTQAKVMNEFDVENKRLDVSRAKVSETITDDIQTSQTQALPEGFFDDKDADLRARGITPVKLDIKDEYKEFEKLIQEDLKEVDNRLEEEEYDAADMIEEAETVEQKTYRERVEILKKKKLELKAARSIKRSKAPQLVEKESSDDESSSDEDSDDAVDWRAKHL